MASATGEHGIGEGRIEAAILHLLRKRGEGKSICPSEAARFLGGEERAGWQPLMEPVRAVAWRMAREGRIVITQHGHAVDAPTAKGPIRLRLR